MTKPPDIADEVAAGRSPDLFVGEPIRVSSPKRKKAKAGPEVGTELLLYRSDVIARRLQELEGRIVFWRSQFYRYDGRCYRGIAESELIARIAAMVEAQGLWGKPAQSKHERATSFELPRWPDVPVVKKRMVASTADVRETVLQLRKDLVPSELDAPCWIDGLEEEPARFPAHEVLCCRNGLCHPRTHTLLEHTPSYFGLGTVDYDYDPAAQAPSWHRFLTELFGEDTESRDALQELVGYFLFPDTTRHRIGLIVGPKRGGKGTIARVLRALLGPLNVAGPTLSSLDTDFGLWPLIDRRLAIISDARLGHGANQSVIVERLLAVSGEDAITVNRKYMTPWTGTLPTRFLILSNELPRLGDASAAMASRFLLITLTRSWFGKEDIGLTTRLLGELPGILLWAIDGYKRMVERGRFVQPTSAGDALQELEDLSSPMTAFVRDWCERGDETTSVKALYEAWCVFCDENGRQHPGTVQSFGRDFRAAFPDLRIERPAASLEGGRPRAVHGLGLSFYAKRKIQEAERENEKPPWRRDWKR